MRKTKGKSNKKAQKDLARSVRGHSTPPPLKQSAMQGEGNEQIKFCTKFNQNWDWEVSIQFSSKEVNGDFIYNSFS